MNTLRRFGRHGNAKHSSVAGAVIPVATGHRIIRPRPAQRWIGRRWRRICRNDDYRAQGDAENDRAPTRASPAMAATYNCHVTVDVDVAIHVGVAVGICIGVAICACIATRRLRSSAGATARLLCPTAARSLCCAAARLLCGLAARLPCRTAATACTRTATARPRTTATATSTLSVQQPIAPHRCAGKWIRARGDELRILCECHGRNDG